MASARVQRWALMGPETIEKATKHDPVLCEIIKELVTTL